MSSVNVNILSAAPMTSIGANSVRESAFYGNNSELIRRLCSTSSSVEEHTENDRSITETSLGSTPDEVNHADVEPEPDHFDAPNDQAGQSTDSDETLLANQQLAGLIAEYAKNQEMQENSENTASTSFSDSAKPIKVTWMRNAGRKKTHPVWHFFKDLRDLNGVGGVNCLHCSWSGEDRSPNNLKTHLKRFHEADGIYERFSLMLSRVGR
ncbi:hypothetical protein L596_023635 [Steinernema carpocapsae]|uniref:Uncharacterized protein n=1 Tax=Steinernema carpocapsae TaxID=34508 RepID=A0A4U5ME84_STECR|nr:hypothetical protein L596_023635 [Steinernema carpocapsae]